MAGASSQGQPLASRRLPAQLSHQEWAELIAEEARALQLHMTPRQLAEGLGVLEAESNFNEWATSGAHIGPWEESSAFGSSSQRLNPRASTRAALRSWAASGKNWWPAWGNWETGETEGAGPTRYHKFLAIAEAALSGKPSSPAAPGSLQMVPSAPSASLGSDLLHTGLVGVLVLGGLGLMGFGASRVIGGSKAAKAMQS
jgi:hypothetical protein